MLKTEEDPNNSSSTSTSNPSNNESHHTINVLSGSFDDTHTSSPMMMCIA